MRTKPKPTLLTFRIARHPEPDAISFRAATALAVKHRGPVRYVAKRNRSRRSE